MTLIDHRSAIAGEVRAAVAREGVSARSLAREVEMSPASLSRKLRGDVSFSVEELIAIANFLDVSVTSLIPRAESAAA